MTSQPDNSPETDPAAGTSAAEDPSQQNPSASADAPPEAPPRGSSAPRMPARVPTLPFHVVGLGASAGGLEPLEAFFSQIQGLTGCAYVVVQHLSPDFKSFMDELLGKHTQMKVVRVEEDTPVRPDTIYLIPPRRDLTLRMGKLSITEQNPDELPHLPIDRFMASLAQSQRQLAVGIVLSGTGSDGTEGLRAIKRAGGTAFVQDPAEAAFDGMPRNAAETNLADAILPVRDMPQAIEQLIEQGRWNEADSHDVAPGENELLTEIIELLDSNTGTRFSHYRHETLLRRTRRRVKITDAANMTEYVELLRRNHSEIEALRKSLLIGVSEFFRDTEAFETVNAEVLAPLVAHQQGDEPIRVWVAGCSTGEEVYSLAMLLDEQFRQADRSPDYKIFATDVDEEAIATASNGLYGPWLAESISAGRLDRYFEKRDENYVVVPALRDRILFSTHDLLADPPFSHLDLVTCRNLLIYFKPETQKQALATFSFALRRDGYLFLGKSESLDKHNDNFASISSKWRIFQNTNPRSRTQRQGLASRPSVTIHRPKTPAAKDRPERDENRLLVGALNELTGSHKSACLIVNAAGELLHSFGNLQGLIHVSPGRTSFDVRKMTDPELAVPLSTALSLSVKRRKEVSYARVILRDRELTVSLRVSPLGTSDGGAHRFLVTIEPAGVPASRASDADLSTQDEDVQQRIHDLEAEVSYTRESLQATIEELETSNEQLQATNEELTTSNEELQSSNEELQSLTEELQTVNTEYQRKIEELTQTNTDLDNLLLSTTTGTLFLDQDLCIRKYTPPVTHYLNVIQQDLGRPIAHISNRLSYPDLLADARQVLQTGQYRELECRNDDGTWVLTTIAPYRRRDSKPGGGVVITFVDITKLKNAQERIRKQAEILDSADVGIIVKDLDGKIISWNSGAERIYGYPAEEMIGQDIRTLALPGHGDDIDCDLDKVGKGQSVARMQRTRQTRSGKEVWISHAVSPVHDANGNVTGSLCISIDLPADGDSDEKRLHDLHEQNCTLAEQVARLREQLDQASAARALPGPGEGLMAEFCQLARVGGWELDLESEEMKPYWTPEVNRIHGVTANYRPTLEEALGFYTPESAAQLKPALQRAIDTGTPYDLELELVTTSGDSRWVRATGKAHRRDGKPIRIVGTYQDITPFRKAPGQSD